MSRTIESIISIILGVFSFSLFVGMNGSIHREMTSEDVYCEKLKKASYKDFKKAFERVEWEVIQGYPDSLEGKNGTALFHASIVRFGSVGYMMTSLGIVLATRLKNKKIKSLRYTKEWID